MGTKVTKEDRKNWMELCNKWFDKLAEKLEGSYTVVKSPYSNDRYLVMKGEEWAISFYGKPILSFRVADHWNWRSKLSHCNNPNWIQCYTKDLRGAFPRQSEGGSSRPILACCVAYYGLDRKYHVVYGEKLDRELQTTTIMTRSVDEVIQDLADDMCDLAIERWRSDQIVYPRLEEERQKKEEWSISYFREMEKH